MLCRMPLEVVLLLLVEARGSPGRLQAAECLGFEVIFPVDLRAVAN